MGLKILVISTSVLCGILLISVQAQLDAQSPTPRRRVSDTAKLTPSRQTEVNRGSTVVTSEFGDLVTYPNSKIAFICGPQLKVNSRLNPFPWFDSTQIKYGHIHGKAAPSVVPRVLTGTVSVRPNSRIVKGTGTRFRSEVDPNGPAPFYDGWLRILEGATEREVKVASIQSNTQLTLTSIWRFGPVDNGKADTFHYESTRSAWNYDHYSSSAYYDTALVQYINYYRTGDPAFLGYARKMADALWASGYIDFGTVTQGPNHLPPRSQAFAGLMLRALDGKPEYWDYLYREVRSTFDVWLKRNRNNARLSFDIRENGFAQLYAVMLARVLPDHYALYADGTSQSSTGVATDGAQKRALLLADAEDIAVNFFGRLQQPDGSWRWDADVGSAPTDRHWNTEQPFMIGLYLESVVLLHQLTANTRVKANLREQITRACRHLYRDAYRGGEVVRDMPRFRWRSMWYFWGGGTVANPRAYERGHGERAINGDPRMITQTRQLNSTIHHAFGYAYVVTGDPSYLKMGDEIFDASYGDQVDGLHSLADSHRARDYDMNYRASGHYLVWRQARNQSGAPDWRGVESTQPATAVRNPNSLQPSTAPKSLFLISRSLTVARQLSTHLANKEQIQDLINQIEGALRAFRIERNRYVLPDRVSEELLVALANARTALSLAGNGLDRDDLAKLRLGWTAARLKRANDQLKPK